MKRIIGIGAMWMLAAAGAMGAEAKKADRTFGEDVAFLRQHVETVVLKGPSGRRVAVVPAYQGRVMTSSALGEDGASFGFLKYDVIARGVPPEAERKGLDRHILVFGGEERFWIGPEGGQHAIYFPPGTTNFTFDAWKTPPLIDDAAYEVVESTRDAVTFKATGTLTNVAGTVFGLGIQRTVRLLDEPALAQALGGKLPPGLAVVGYETDNRLQNPYGPDWTRDTGLLSIWLLGMFKPGPRTTVVIPVVPGDAAKLGPAVNTDYFGPVAGDRLVVTNGVAFFRCDGKSRTKIGIPRARAKPVCGSWDAAAGVLTVVRYNLPAGAASLPYVKSQWAIHADPYVGDVINAYNDGPNETGDQLGPFYEIETSSPALPVASGGEIRHVSQTLHLQGDRADLDAVARAALGVGLDAIEKALP
jgi:hypothetical protein